MMSLSSCCAGPGQCRASGIGWRTTCQLSGTAVPWPSGRYRRRAALVPPLSDGPPQRRSPFSNIWLVIAMFAVWLFYELQNLNSAFYRASFSPGTIANACQGPEPGGVTWITAMFLHGSWDHILGN